MSSGSRNRMNSISQFLDVETMEILKGGHRGEFMQTEPSESPNREDHTFVPLNADVPSHFSNTDFTDNTNQQNVDVSAHVPAGAIAVEIAWFCNDNAITYINVYQTGYTNYFNSIKVVVINQSIMKQMKAPLDDNRTFDVKFSANPTTWINAQFTIVGYYI